MTVVLGRRLSRAKLPYVYFVAGDVIRFQVES